MTSRVAGARFLIWSAPATNPPNCDFPCAAATNRSGKRGSIIIRIPSPPPIMKMLSLEPSKLWMTARRLVFLLAVGLTVLLISGRTFAMLQINGLNPLKTVGFALFVVLLVPIALSFWTAAIGFLVQCRGGDSLDLTRALAGIPDGEIILPRTAIVMPVYNEDPVRVFAGLKVTYQDLEKTGRLPAFDFFILSDTTDPDIWVREEMAFAQLRREVTDPARLVYRNRRENVDRKMGNIADFCATWGEHY